MLYSTFLARTCITLAAVVLVMLPMGVTLIQVALSIRRRLGELQLPETHDVCAASAPAGATDIGPHHEDGSGASDREASLGLTQKRMRNIAIQLGGFGLLIFAVCMYFMVSQISEISGTRYKVLLEYITNPRTERKHSRTL